MIKFQEKIILSAMTLSVIGHQHNKTNSVLLIRSLYLFDNFVHIVSTACKCKQISCHHETVGGVDYWWSFSKIV